MYAMVTHYSFDKPQVDLFTTFEEAREYLFKTASNEYRIAAEENEWNAELSWNSEDSKQATSATLIEHFQDRDDITEFEIASLLFDHRS